MKFINFIKENYNNPKAKLAFYTIFIVIIILLIRMGNTNKKVIEIDYTSSLKQTNYQFEYYINYQENYYNISGIRYNHEQLLDYNDQNYYFKDSILYEITDNKITKSTLDSNILTDLLSENIYNNIINSSKTSELNIDNVVTRTYNINYKNYQFEVITHQSNNQVNTIEINQSALNLHITINYSNIGKVNEIEANYEEV